MQHQLLHQIQVYTVMCITRIIMRSKKIKLMKMIINKIIIKHQITNGLDKQRRHHHLITLKNAQVHVIGVAYCATTKKNHKKIKQ